jgi:hypothetical protein
LRTFDFASLFCNEISLPTFDRARNLRSITMPDANYVGALWRVDEAELKFSC